MRLPAPLLHDGDGGRYLNTFGLVCVQTPDKKWTNWSIARVMLVDRVRMAGIVAPNQHLGMVRKQWTDLGQDMPFALALGVEPFLPFVGGMPLPAYVDEADFAGAGQSSGGVPQARRKDVFPHDQSHLQLPATGSYDSTSQTEQLSRNLFCGITGSGIEIVEGVWILADE